MKTSIIPNKDQINVFDVANYIINNFSKKCEFTQMKLQKIVFYIYIQFLIENNCKPMFDETLEAWRYGPVFPNLYLKLQHHRNNPITKSIKEGQENKLLTKHKKIIDKIINQYGSYTAGELVEKTHSEAPWQNNFLDADWSCNVISDKDLYDFYVKKNT